MISLSLFLSLPLCVSFSVGLSSPARINFNNRFNQNSQSESEAIGDAGGMDEYKMKERVKIMNTDIKRKRESNTKSI